MSAPADDHPLRPVPRGRYVDFELAGEGAMGLVYLALDQELNRSVAFKLVRPDAGEAATGATPRTPLDVSAPTSVEERFAELEARFLQEARVTGALEHPGIVPVYELGRTEGGVPYYTMRFVRGQRTLDTAIHDLDGCPFDDRLVLLEPFLKLCDAIAYAHARGVIHRDLKPANIALGEYGEVVVLDWGLAKPSTEAAPAAPAAHAGPGFQTDAHGPGTRGYMPPEAVRGDGDALDPRADVYSLGVILYQILTGRLPFAVEPFPTYYEQVTREDPPRARALQPDVPEALDRLCAQALAPVRDERLPDVPALADGVRQWQKQSAIEREVEGLMREARAALSAAADAKGPSRIRQTQRAMEALATARRRRPESRRLQRLQSEARALRNQGIDETARESRRRLMLVGGVTLLVLVTIASFVVAGLLDERRRDAEQANRATQVALEEVRLKREEARRQEQAARAARAVAEREAQEARSAYDLVRSLLWSMRDADEGGTDRADVLDRSSKHLVASGNVDGLFLLIEEVAEAHRHGRLAEGEALRAISPPPALADAERQARARTASAQRAFLATQDSGNLTAMREARRARKEATAEHARALDAVERHLRQQLERGSFGTTTVEQVQAALEPGEAFVRYGRSGEDVVAVVVGRDEKQIVRLGAALQIDGAIEGLWSALQREEAITLVMKILRRLVVEPLALPETRGRVIVAPFGTTLAVPFTLLLPQRAVRTVPSAGAWLHLRARSRASGDGVLAVSVGVVPGSPAMPGAREEAKAVGTAVLVGPEATWSNLTAALRRRSHWHSVHLACDGRLATAERQDARLELTPEEDDDGIVDPREIARTPLPADLVVLSTAHLQGTQGLETDPTLALPQACLFAGARRVLFPVYPPDDAATRALMVRFYELWNPPGGGPGLDAASALAEAQAFVRAEARWRAPRYWAAWVLWGES